MTYDVDGSSRRPAPSVVAEATLAALANGEEEVFPDAMAKEVAKNFKADWKALEKSMAGSPVAA